MPPWDDAAGELEQGIDALEDGRTEAALAAFTVVIDRHRDEAASCARLGAGIALRRLGRPAEAVAVLDELLVAEPGPDHVRCALAEKVRALQALGRLDELIVVADALAARGGGPRAWGLALLARAEALAARGDHGHAAQAERELTATCGPAVVLVLEREIGRTRGRRDAPARRDLAGSLLRQARLLARLGREDEALRAADELLGTFARDTGGPIASIVRAAGALRAVLVAG